MDIMEKLLSMEIPNPPEKEYKIKRLSRLCGEDIVFKLKALSYSRVADLLKMSDADSMGVHIVLAGVVSPDLKNAGLLAKYQAVTPDELVKKMFLPGEVEDLKRAIERLSGYRVSTIEDVEEIKKKSETIPKSV